MLFVVLCFEGCGLTYINDVYVGWSISWSGACYSDWTCSSADLNTGQGSVYYVRLLWWPTTNMNDLARGIRGLRATISSTALQGGDLPDGWHRIGEDINVGRGVGVYIYLEFTRDPSYGPVFVDLNVFTSSQPEDQVQPTPGWVLVKRSGSETPANMNHGTNGGYIYIEYKLAPETTVTSSPTPMRSRTVTSLFEKTGAPRTINPRQTFDVLARTSVGESAELRMSAGLLWTETSMLSERFVSGRFAETRVVRETDGKFTLDVLFPGLSEGFSWSLTRNSAALPSWIAPASVRDHNTFCSGETFMVDSLRMRTGAMMGTKGGAFVNPVVEISQLATLPALASDAGRQGSIALIAGVCAAAGLLAVATGLLVFYLLCRRAGNSGEEEDTVGPFVSAAGGQTVPDADAGLTQENPFSLDSSCTEEGEGCGALANGHGLGVTLE